MTKHIWCDFKPKFNSSTCNINYKCNNNNVNNVNVNVKVIVSAKKITIAILGHVFVRIAIFLKILLILRWLSVMKL